MADLDDEFARFEAELQSLEQPSEATNPDSHDRETPVKAADDEEPPAKKAKGVGGGLTAPAKVVVVSKPKVYMAPPRPTPAKKPQTFDEPSSSTNGSAIPTTAPGPVSLSRPGRPNTLEDVAAHRGALSGFPMGTSGVRAASDSMSRNAGAGSLSQYSGSAFRLPMQPRVDMDTGCVLPVEEQEMMNLQQSVYEYDPNRAAASVVSGPQARDGSGRVGPAARAQGAVAGQKKPKHHLRLGGGAVWEDPTLADWPENDFRLFCGDLGNEVSDELLAHSFAKYASFQRARVVRDKLTHKSRGYGFVSFADPFDCAKALREMNGKYIGNRPVKLSKSKWEDRNLEVAKKKMSKRKRDKHHLFN
ncbi:hypothetical protein BBJ28_00005386 [Nothophytophthora sp. Chile5]|nr:hypothetical protein BBJ28_00005386 [Nothophytophthora sp. Chile5]